MAEAIRPGGVYQAGKDRFVDAHGNEVDAPTRDETRAQREEAQAAEQQLQAAYEAGGTAVPAPSVPRREAKDGGERARRKEG